MHFKLLVAFVDDSKTDAVLTAARESGATLPLRPAANLPSADFVLTLGDLEDGRLGRELPVGEHVDSVTLQVVDPEGKLDRSFEYVDLEGLSAGDYYYVRVTQLDGGRAWSSPWWVGGSETVEARAAGR